jgi:uncharacterized membrane protein
MINQIKGKLYLLGYAMIFYGIIRFGYFVYISFYLGNAILNNQEQTIIDSNSVTIISKSQFDYTNIILVISLYFAYSIVPILLGVFIIKKRNKGRINSAIK